MLTCALGWLCLFCDRSSAMRTVLFSRCCRGIVPSSMNLTRRRNSCTHVSKIRRIFCVGSSLTIDVYLVKGTSAPAANPIDRSKWQFLFKWFKKECNWRKPISESCSLNLESISSWGRSLCVALSAVYGSAAIGLEWYFAFLSTLSANCLVHLSFLIRQFVSTPSTVAVQESLPARFVHHSRRQL